MTTSPEHTSFSAESVTITPDITIDELLALMQRAQLPIETYGTGSAKTLLHLLKEINDGESLITVDPSGKLHRQVNAVALNVFHTDKQGLVWKLKETRQVFKSGRVRERQLESSIGEKLKPGEEMQAAAERALREELGILQIESLRFLGSTTDTWPAVSYPGLSTTYGTHRYDSVIGAESFSADGYVEVQEDKTNYYTWEQV